jgi:hypothetical protein
MGALTVKPSQSIFILIALHLRRFKVYETSLSFKMIKRTSLLRDFLPAYDD